eukprot:8988445-Karenia_brevis.AAC.1
MQKSLEHLEKERATLRTIANALIDHMAQQMKTPKESEGMLRLIQAVAQSTSTIMDKTDAHGHAIAHAVGEISKIETEMCSTQVAILGCT